MGRRPASRVLAAGLLAILCVLGGAPAAAQDADKVCLNCHGSDPKVMAILHSRMAVKGDPRTPFGEGGCQTCHGDSRAHLAQPAAAPDVVFHGPRASPVAARNGVCLGCHQDGHRINWRVSPHAVNEIACTDCHTKHIDQDPVLAKPTQPQVCFTCHAEQRADTIKFSHHPIREGKVVCADCHDPHGSPGPKLLRAVTVNETCYLCHAEKRGPLLWEHMPVRENCLNCHTPHGSNQPALLVQRPPFLCQECHGNGAHQNNPMSAANVPGPKGAKTFAGTTTVITDFRAFLRGCVNCHSQVHGSNSPSGMFFTR